MERGPFQMKIQGAVARGRFQNPTECEPIRKLPSGQLLRAAVAEELRHRRSRVPNRKAAAASPSARTGSQGDQEFAARRLGARTPTDQEHDLASLKCQSAHPPQPPLGQRFRSARAEESP